MSENLPAAGESLSALGELGADVIPRLSHVDENSSDLGETFTDAGQKLIDRGSPFTEGSKNANAAATPPFAGGARS